MKMLSNQIENASPISHERPVRLSELPPEWKRLIRLAQKIEFGEIAELTVAGGLPLLKENQQIVIDRVLGKNRRESRDLASAADFTLKPQWTEFLQLCQEEKHLDCVSIEIRNGLPCQVKYRMKLARAAAKINGAAKKKFG